MLSSLKADRACLLDLKARIVDLERSRTVLRSEQVLVQERLDAYKYPVWTLPNELTSQIFIHSLPVYPDLPPLIGIIPPTSLTHICRHWREVALATPQLWRAIKFVDSSFTVRNEALLHICNAWIARSRSCPLSIEIELEMEHNAVYAEPLFMAIARWEHLKLYAPASFLPQLGGPMPMLRSLDLLGDPDDDSDGPAFNDVPHLRTVVVTMSKVTLPWIHLTCLTLNYATVDQCIRILAQTLNLVQCTLVFIDDDYDEPRLDSLDLPLPYLELLVLKQEGPFPGFCSQDDFSNPSLSLLSAGSNSTKHFLVQNPFLR
ncbi:hypothetical protein B0H12DRAFT_1329255 [Mycena haematopus]|nr:hypothetical protein B0H12DRAFT_1329255 [Mycena haematopus]